MRLNDLHEVTTRYQHLYLSPHFDDVVFSCGGTLAAQAAKGQGPLVITVFGALPRPITRLYSFAYRVHRGMGYNYLYSCYSRAVVSSRRREDAAALHYLHSDYLWLDHLDAVYRGEHAYSPYYTRHDQLMSSVPHVADSFIEQAIAADLLALHRRLPHATWYAPLGVGGHVDHHIVFSVACTLLRHGARCVFYEDFPYAAEEGMLQGRMKALGVLRRAEVVCVSDSFHLRTGAARFYTSQIQMSFGSVAAMHSIMDEYARSLDPSGRPCERYWHLSAPASHARTPSWSEGLAIP